MKIIKVAIIIGVLILSFFLSPKYSQAIMMGGYWTYTTQYVANTNYPYFGFNGRIQVAVPDKYPKLCIIYKICSSSYPSGRSYTVNFYDGYFGVTGMGVGEVGPWNQDDNWWDPSYNWIRARRLFKDIPQGISEADMAVCCGYNNGRDQFGRIITTRPFGPGMDICQLQLLHGCIGDI